MQLHVVSLDQFTAAKNKESQTAMRKKKPVQFLQPALKKTHDTCYFKEINWKIQGSLTDGGVLWGSETCLLLTGKTPCLWWCIKTSNLKYNCLFHLLEAPQWRKTASQCYPDVES